MTDIPAALGLDPDGVHDVLTTAARAPSLHNTQPWRFHVVPDRIDLWADPDRRLWATDPTGAEQRLACGAALYNLRLALHGHGIRPLVTLHTEPDHPDLLATIRYGGRKPPTQEQRRLLRAVPHRHTNRHPFTDEPVTPTEITALRRAALEESAWLHIVDDPATRTEVAHLAAAATRTQHANPAYHAELAHWVAVDPDRTDGVPARTNEHRPAPHDRWIHRDFTAGHGPTTTETETRYEHHPTIAVLAPHLFGSTTETTTGQALQRVLLTATADGLAVSFLSQLIEVPQTRTALHHLIHSIHGVRGIHGPHAVLRIGHGFPVPTTPRRPVTDILTTQDPTRV